MWHLFLSDFMVKLVTLGIVTMVQMTEVIYGSSDTSTKISSTV